MNSAWRPSSGTDAAQQRAALQTRIREYFRGQDVLEVDTPSLVSGPPADPNIDSLVIRQSAAATHPLYLHASPEYAMKRLLAAGYPDIYSLCRVFRDGEVGRNHQPEFTMLEWYRRGFDLQAIVADTIKLIEYVLARDFVSTRLGYRDAFIQHAGIDPDTAELVELQDGCDPALLESLGDHRDGWLDLIFSLRVAPKFDPNALTVISGYPLSQAALARPDPQDSQVAERFEVFLGARELANGYVELTDADIFVARQNRDLDIRRRNKQSVNPVDQNFLAAMRHGLPQCAGVALGFERLHMIAAGAEHIREVITFEFEQ